MLSATCTSALHLTRIGLISRLQTHPCSLGWNHMYVCTCMLRIHAVRLSLIIHHRWENRVIILRLVTFRITRTHRVSPRDSGSSSPDSPRIIAGRIPFTATSRCNAIRRASHRRFLRHTPGGTSWRILRSFDQNRLRDFFKIPGPSGLIALNKIAEAEGRRNKLSFSRVITRVKLRKCL